MTEYLRKLYESKWVAEDDATAKFLEVQWVKENLNE